MASLSFKIFEPSDDAFFRKYRWTIVSEFFLRKYNVRRPKFAYSPGKDEYSPTLA